MAAAVGYSQPPIQACWQARDKAPDLHGPLHAYAETSNEEPLMPLKGYGVLKGTPVGHLRDADDDHYQILIRAGSTVYRIAANVRSA